MKRAKDPANTQKPAKNGWHIIDICEEIQAVVSRTGFEPVTR
jgi:hypothetical protein